MLRWVLHNLYKYNALLVLASVSLLIITSPFFTLFGKSNRLYDTVLANLSMKGTTLSHGQSDCVEIFIFK